MSAHDALELIFTRNAFYKRLHFLALGAFGLALLVIIGLSLTLTYLVKNPSHPLYFATDEVGRLIQVVPVNTPNMSPEEVTAWVVDAVQAVNSYDYINYRKQLQGAEKYFTAYGWKKYMTALNNSGNLRALTNRKQVVLATVVGDPVVKRQGILSGAYAWMYEMQLLITYMMPPYDGQTADSKYQNAWNVRVIVQRQNVLNSYKGLGIVQLVLSQAVETSSTSTMQDSSMG